MGSWVHGFVGSWVHGFVANARPRHFDERLAAFLTRGTARARGEISQAMRDRRFRRHPWSTEPAGLAKSGHLSRRFRQQTAKIWPRSGGTLASAGGTSGKADRRREVSRGVISRGVIHLAWSLALAWGQVFVFRRESISRGVRSSSRVGSGLRFSSPSGVRSSFFGSPSGVSRLGSGLRSGRVEVAFGESRIRTHGVRSRFSRECENRRPDPDS
jgi:hypothetical protein